MQTGRAAVHVEWWRGAGGAVQQAAGEQHSAADAAAMLPTAHHVLWRDAQPTGAAHFWGVVQLR